MKKLGLLCLLILSACVSPEELAQKDHAFCSQAWGTIREGYAYCRMQREHERKQAGNAAAAMMFGGGMSIYNSRPAPQPTRNTTCQQYGNQIQCMDW